MIFAVGIFLVVISFIASFVAMIWHVVQAFKHSSTWGLIVLVGILFLGSLPSLIFIFKNIKEYGQPVLINIGVIPPMIMGFLLLALSFQLSIYGG